MSVVRRILPLPAPGETAFLSGVLRSESVGGLLALGAAMVALVWANSPADSSYHAFITFDLGPLDLEHWGADGALTLFFFVAGLELKREFVVGSLRRPADALVPVTAALCGVAVPALLYTLVNVTASSGRPGGWAIPAATDIAFALAVLSVVGSHLPASLRAFLLTLAVVDDLVVIVIIAVVFTDTVHVVDLLVSLALAVLWAVLQRHAGRVRLGVPADRGRHVVVHARERGARHHRRRAARPADARTSRPGRGAQSGRGLEHRLSPVSAALAVPFFALVSAGVPISGGGCAASTTRSSSASCIGLVLGKPIGVLGGTYLVTRFTRAELNEDLTWGQMLGVAMLAGIGFTVSLLVSDLSFSGPEADAAKAGVLAASVIAALLGALVLRHPRRVGAK